MKLRKLGSLARGSVTRVTPLAMAISMTMAAGVASASGGHTYSEFHASEAHASSARVNLGNLSKVQASARYIVSFKAPSVIEHFAKQDNAPRITTGRSAQVGRLDLQAALITQYAKQLETQKVSTIQSVGRSIGRDLTIIDSMQHALNAVIVELTPEEAAALEAHPDISMVEREVELTLDTYAGPRFINAMGIWSGENSPVATKGEGIVVGIIDTGINFESPSFAEVGPISGYQHINPLGDGVYLGTCAEGKTDAGLCNAKLIGAYDSTQAIAGNGTANDTDGHGSHTGGTVAGNEWTASIGEIQATISGVAPNANIIAYKACPSSCPSTATARAVNQAILDGVDVINYSISGGTSPWTDSTSVAFRNATAAGIFVAASAGNDGPTEGSVNHMEPWVETVAWSTHDERIGATFSLSGDYTAPEETQNIVLVPGALPWPSAEMSDLPLIKSPTFDDGSNDGCTDYPPGTFSRVQGDPDWLFKNSFEDEEPNQQGLVGGIAVLQLNSGASNCGSGARQGRAIAAGAAGVIFVDAAYINLGANNASWSMLRSDWDLVEKAMDTTSDLASISIAAIVPGEGDMLSPSSSRGPRGFTGNQNLIKPDITAPGDKILAAYAQSVGTGGPTSVASISGTSMSSPHIAGAAALIRAVQPMWTPTQVKSAINLTAHKAVLDFDGSDATKFETGSGRVDVSAAINTGLLMDETIENFINANPASGGDVSTLNMAQFADGKCVGTCTFQRTFRRARVGTETYAVTVTGLPEGTYSVSPSTLTLNTTSSRTLTLSVDGFALPPESWSFGDVVLTPTINTEEPVLQLPIAVHTYGPEIEVTPSAVVGIVGGAPIELDITNTGNPQLNWQLTTEGTAAVTPLQSLASTSGQRGGEYVAGDSLYWLQSFEITSPTEITRLQANSFMLPSATLSASNSVNVSFAVFNDNNGVPAGAPTSLDNGFGEAAIWSYTNTPTTANGFSSASASIAVNLTHASVPSLTLQPGRYWMTVYPRINGNGDGASTSNRLWAWRSSTDVGTGPVPVLYSPSDALDDYFTADGLSLLSATVQGNTTCELPDWLSLSATSGSLGYQETNNLDVVVDSDGLAPGTYSANFCITSNAKNASVKVVPVQITVP